LIALREAGINIQEYEIGSILASGDRSISLDRGFASSNNNGNDQNNRYDILEDTNIKETSHLAEE
jgi:hypothetical protein